MQHPHWQRHRYRNTINLNLGNTGGKSHNFVFHHFVILIISILPDVIDTSAYNIEWTSCYNAWASKILHRTNRLTNTAHNRRATRAT